MEIRYLDHLVLTVADPERSAAFYTTVLGMKKQVFNNGRIALHFGSQKINLHKYEEEFLPRAHAPTPGSADVCLITGTDLVSAMQEIRNLGIDIVQGPVERTGATGRLLSFYIRDPDRNLIEIANTLPDNH